VINAWDHGLVVRVLGPVQVINGGRELPLGAAGPRSMFAKLAMRAGTSVSSDELIDALWGESPPRTARANVYTYISILRKTLEGDCVRSSSPRVLNSTRAGYTLELAAETVDARRFEVGLADARRLWAAGDVNGALVRCEDALAEWGGAPFSGAVGPFAEVERARLELLKLDLQELRCAALVEIRPTGEAIADLSVLTMANPLRERLHELLMLALYRGGRQVPVRRWTMSVPVRCLRSCRMASPILPVVPST
jgi:DNA-binding SARP family transcriptional activator